MKKSLRKALDKLYAALDAEQIGTIAYSKIVDEIAILERLDSEKRATVFGIPTEIIVGSVVNIGGILLVMNYEQLHLVSSAGWKMIGKIKFW